MQFEYVFDLIFTSATRICTYVECENTVRDTKDSQHNQRNEKIRHESYRN